jgi:hypothetical protein
MAGRQIVAAQIQMAMRAGNGKSTASKVTPKKAPSQVNARMTTRAEGWISMVPERVAEHFEAKGRLAGIARNIARDEITRQLGVGQLEKLGECGAFIAIRVHQPLADISQQQEIEFLHAATAAPFQPAQLDVRYRVNAGAPPSSS